MCGNAVLRGIRAVCLVAFACLAVSDGISAPAFGEMIGNNLWNLREDNESFFGANDSWVRPWRGSVDDGWGMFQGGHQFDFLWVTSSTAGNPADGNLSIARGVDHQFDAWTYLYVPTPTTLSLTGDGDCVPR